LFFTVFILFFIHSLPVLFHFFVTYFCFLNSMADDMGAVVLAARNADVSAAAVLVTDSITKGLTCVAEEAKAAIVSAMTKYLREIQAIATQAVDDAAHETERFIKGTPVSNTTDVEVENASMEIFGAYLAKIATAAFKTKLSEGYIVYDTQCNKVCVFQFIECQHDDCGNLMQRVLLEVYPVAVGGDGDALNASGDLSSYSCVGIPVGPLWLAQLDSASATAPRTHLQIRESGIGLVAYDDSGNTHRSYVSSAQCPSTMLYTPNANVTATRIMVKLAVFAKVVASLKKAAEKDHHGDMVFSVNDNSSHPTKFRVLNSDLVKLTCDTHVAITLQRSILDTAITLLKSITGVKILAFEMEASDKPLAVWCIGTNEELLARLFLVPYDLAKQAEYDATNTTEEEEEDAAIVTAAEQAETVLRLVPIEPRPPLPAGLPPVPKKKKVVSKTHQVANVVAEQESPVQHAIPMF
jgi:hypothetical protein